MNEKYYIISDSLMDELLLHFLVNTFDEHEKLDDNSVEFYERLNALRLDQIDLEKRIRESMTWPRPKIGAEMVGA